MDDSDDVELDDDEETEDGPLFSFDEASPMPHWSEPATGEIPIIDTPADPSPGGGSRLFPQLPDDPNLVDSGPDTGVLESTDVAGVEPSPFEPPSSPTGIDLGGSLAGGFDEPAPTGPMEDVFAAGTESTDLDGDLPAPRWGAATGEAAEGFLGDVDPEALASVVDSPRSHAGTESPEVGPVEPDDFVGDDLDDLDELLDSDAALSRFLGERLSTGDGEPGSFVVQDDSEMSGGPAAQSADLAPQSVSQTEPDADDLNAWSALEDPSPVWREGAQDYETHRAADDTAERMILHMPTQQSTTKDTGAASTGRNMPIAIVVGITLAAVFLALLDRGPGYAMIMVVPLLVIAASEFFVSVRKVGYRPATLLGLATVAGLPLAAYWRGPEAILLVLTISMIFALLWYLLGVELDRPSANVSVTMAGVLWVGLLGAHIPLILLLPHGSGIFLGAVIGTVAYDVAGLFIGRATGQSRLAPNVSPNKTYEGLIGGMIVSILVVTFGLGLAPGLTPWDLNQVDALLLGVVVAVVAPLGDLAQSLVKRDLDIKDMGTILPGHGGVFDRFDALLFVIPAVYYLALARDLNVLG